MVISIDLGNPTITSAVSTVVKTREIATVDVSGLGSFVGIRRVEEKVPPFPKGL
jgi:hypothetical protein